MAGYSEDLRVRVVEYLKKGHTIKETAETFGVSPRSICIWKKMDKGIPFDRNTEKCRRRKLSDLKFKRCSIVAGKCGEEVLAPFGYYGTCNSELFPQWVKEMLASNLKENQIVIMDNASIHKSPKIREAIEEAGCSLVYQPLYSPDLNPIEHFWSHLKQEVGALKQKFESIFDAIQYVLAN